MCYLFKDDGGVRVNGGCPFNSMYSWHVLAGVERADIYIGKTL